MKTCNDCKAPNPDTARYCMRCGHQLALAPDPVPDAPPSGAGFGMLGLSLLASLVLSLILMFVFRLPVFLVFGFLPLLWRRKR
jgi:hypothetical protein